MGEVDDIATATTTPPKSVGPPGLAMPAGRDGGFILPSVLAGLLLLALAALAVSRSVAIDIKLTAAAERRARAEALADGLARLAIHHLQINAPVANRSGHIPLDGVVQNCRVGRSLARISFVDADGLLNLNQAQPALLERVLAGVGLSDAEARRMAGNIVDFRTPGDTSLAGGSKRAAYQMAGLAHGPKTDDLASVAELDQVAGMTPALLARLRPVSTVHSRFGTLNVQVASLPVLRALAGAGTVIDASSAADLDALRGKLVIPPEFTYVPRGRTVRKSSSDAYVVRVAVHRPGGGVFVREAVVVRGENGAPAPAIKAWTSPMEADALPAGLAADQVPQCVGGILELEAASAGVSAP